MVMARSATGTTRMTAPQRAVLPAASVTVNSTQFDPPWPPPGTQWNPLITPLAGPDSGSAGVITAPAGSPLAVKVMVSPVSGSVPSTEKSNGCPARTTNGPGGVTRQTGGRFV